MLFFILAAGAAAATPADRWSDCLVNKVQALVPGPGTPDAIADQAMRFCSPGELAVRRSIEQDAGGASAQEVSRELDKMSRETREEMRKLAIELRAASASSRPQQRAASPAKKPSFGDELLSAMLAPSATDERAAARAKAARAQQAPAGPLNLKLKVFNSGTVPVASMNTIAPSGSVGPNWLKEAPIAVSAFRTFTFTNAACTRTLRITFSTGASLSRPLNFCGKTTLYISNRDMWVE
ncbi:MAG: hypothetical protein ABW039_00770 [Sphingobium sp.]